MSTDIKILIGAIFSLIIASIVIFFSEKKWVTKIKKEHVDINAVKKELEEIQFLSKIDIEKEMFKVVDKNKIPPVNSSIKNEKKIKVKVRKKTRFDTQVIKETEIHES